MTVTLNSAGGSSVPNWQLLQSPAPTGVATVTFSGLANYSKYRVLAPNLICTTGNTTIQMRLNGDSTSVYNQTSDNGIGALTGVNRVTPTQAAQIAIGNVGITNPSGFQVDIDGALTLTPKTVTGEGISASSTGQVNAGIFGFYYGTNATITSITIFLASNNFSTGTIYLLGAN